MDTKIQYPEIEFVETDVETIENSMIALFELMYEQETGKKKKVYPASPERLFTFPYLGYSLYQHC